MGFIVRKPLLEIFKKMDVKFKELEKDEAKEVLDRFAETKGMTITIGQLIKSYKSSFLCSNRNILCCSKETTLSLRY